MTTDKKNEVLLKLAELIKTNENLIINANNKDVLEYKGTDSSMLDRLKVNGTKIDGLITALKQAVEIDDPEGKILYSHTREDGLRIENVAVPFGKILIIYESRPDVTVEAALTAFKAGNKILLKGGKEARNTNLYLTGLWHKALEWAGISTNYVNYLDVSRDEISKIIKENTYNIDLIIPRGGDELIKFVRENSSVPVIVSGRGNNFLYVDIEADYEMAAQIILNGKKRVSVCNALDKVLINSKINTKEIVNIASVLHSHSIEIVGDAEVCKILPQAKLIDDDLVWSEEFLAPKIMLSLVDGLGTAIEIINKYSGGHSAVIVTSNNNHSHKFMNEVDCAAVYCNASTRFTDGGQFGLSAEIAISTQKLHFRGPLGIGQLVTNKWLVYGNGHIRE